MIVLVGIPSEPPVAMALDALVRAGSPHVMVNQRDSADHRLESRIENGVLQGELHLADRTLALSEISALYARFGDHRVLPEREGLADDDPAAIHIDRLHEQWIRLVDLLPGRVVNRLGAMSSNSSKPYQAQLINAVGLGTPHTLVTTDPAAARQFVTDHGPVIYKSVSGIRSIVRTVCDDDLERLDQVRTCPTQFQAFVPGDDVRVHVVGDAIHATIIRSDAQDYRYARLENEPAELEPFELPDALAATCRELTARLGLWFSGIDLRIHGDDVTCFEVNPSPAYSYYEANTGQAISDDLAVLLAAA